MRILHVITKLELGGAQQNTLYTCRRLAERGHDVTLAAGPGGLLDGDARRGPFAFVPLAVLHREIRPLDDARAIAALTRLVRRGRFDVVHTHSSKAGALGRLAGRLGRARRVVHTVHGWSFAPHMPAASRWIYRAIEHACAPLADHVVSVSRLDLESGERLGLVRPGRGSVIRSGIDLDEFAPDGPGRDEVRAEWGVAPDEVLVVNVSNFKPQKAPLDFVRAAGRVARARGCVRFAFVGDGELRPDVDRCVADEGLVGRMTLAGWRGDVASVLRAADVVALTSLWEGLPRTLVQARAVGRAVVATRVNGVAEIVDDGETGLLTAPGDVDGFAAALDRVVSEPELRARLARRRIDRLAEFDQERMVDQQEELYRRLCGGG